MILQTIKQREEVFDKEFFDVETELGTDIPIYNQLPAIKSFHRQSIIAVLKAEIEWLEGEKKVNHTLQHDLKGKCDFAFNQALDQTITHLEEIIKELEV